MNYKYCPNCKYDLVNSQEKDECKNCGFIHYIDPVVGASAIPVRDGKVLLAIRKHEPYKDTYDVIGGFVKIKESAEDAVIRETKEETGLDVEVVKLLGTYPDRYGVDGPHILVEQFIVKIIGGEAKANDDVKELVWVPISEIPKLDLERGFVSVKKTLTDLYEQFGRGAEN